MDSDNLDRSVRRYAGDVVWRAGDRPAGNGLSVKTKPAQPEPDTSAAARLLLAKYKKPNGHGLELLKRNSGPN